MRSGGLRRLGRLLAVGVGLPLSLAAACYAKWGLADGKFATITPGAVYQSAALAPARLVQACRARGIRTVIDLRDSRPDAVAACAGAAAAAGLVHLHVPTRSHPFRDDAEAFLAALESAERPVLVHCQHGEGRSVMLCAVHRIANEGWSNERAFDGTARLPDSLRFLNDWFPGLRRFKRAHPKGRFVLSYDPRRAPGRASKEVDSPLSALPR